MVGDDLQASDFHHLRGVDTNSLLRMYDAATLAAGSEHKKKRREDLERGLSRVAKELTRRNEPTPRAGRR